jgi:hypothetical protein
MMAACFYWKDHVWLMFIYVYIYIELIQIFKSVFRKSMPLFVSRNTQNRSPHRDTLSGKLTKNLKEDLVAQVLAILYEEEWAFKILDISAPRVSKRESSCTHNSRNPDS